MQNKSISKQIIELGIVLAIVFYVPFGAIINSNYPGSNGVAGVIVAAIFGFFFSVIILGGSQSGFWKGFRASLITAVVSSAVWFVVFHILINDGFSAPSGDVFSFGYNITTAFDIAAITGFLSSVIIRQYQIYVR